MTTTSRTRQDGKISLYDYLKGNSFFKACNKINLKHCTLEPPMNSKVSIFMSLNNMVFHSNDSIEVFCCLPLKSTVSVVVTTAEFKESCSTKNVGKF